MNINVLVVQNNEVTSISMQTSTVCHFLLIHVLVLRLIHTKFATDRLQTGSLLTSDSDNWSEWNHARPMQPTCILTSLKIVASQSV